ncbi:hypothetical protein [Paraburkholderia strydomiana]|uniref:hypothetical protein n=1 Tax=Paraburkholderia strydomiana TaxID=1245417 RepID=UPI0038BA59A5
MASLQELHASELPVRREPGVEVRVLSGRSGEVAAATENYAPFTGLEMRLDVTDRRNDAGDDRRNGASLK